MKINVAAVVVLYNPNDITKENIASYIDSIKKLYIVDNSNNKNMILVNALIINKKIKYIDNNGNRGIAHALNVGANEAIKDGYNFLLTIDQDSRFEKDSLRIMIKWLVNTNAKDIAIVSPLHMTMGIEYKVEERASEVTTVMTSGNLLNLKAYLETGPFCEDFFIDYVDHEYCLRLKIHGYKILILHNAVLKHNLGDIREYNFFFKHVKSTNHSSLRRYYMTRNRLKVSKDYFFRFPRFCVNSIWGMMKEWIKIILFEENKMEKQKFMFCGLIDFIIGKYGKYEK